jgi:ElaB/YqjD/DUF883 family membrane-anchored ribosome-binding protein
MAKTSKDTFGYLGTEPVALREELARLVAALDEMAKAEGTEAVKATAEAARRIAGRASELAEEVAGAARAARATADVGRRDVEAAIRDKPWIAVSLAAVAGFLLASLVRR